MITRPDKKIILATGWRGVWRIRFKKVQEKCPTCNGNIGKTTK